MADSDSRRFGMEAADVGLEPGRRPGPAGVIERRPPHLQRAHLAAARARLQAERVRAWKRWHAEMFEQMRVQAIQAQVPAGAAVDDHGLHDEWSGRLDLQRPSSLPLSNQRAPRTDPNEARRPEEPGNLVWTPKPERGQWQGRPSFERTKAAAAESMFSTEGLLRDPPGRHAGQEPAWPGLIKRILGRRRPGPGIPPVASGTSDVTPAGRVISQRERRLLEHRADRGAAPAEQPPTPNSFSRQEGRAVLQTYMGRMRAQLQAAPSESDARAPERGNDWLPVPSAGSPPAMFHAWHHAGATGAASAPRGMSEPWFAAVIFTAAFLVVAVPYVLLERGVLPAASAFGTGSDQAADGGGPSEGAPIRPPSDDRAQAPSPAPTAEVRARPRQTLPEASAPVARLAATAAQEGTGSGGEETVSPGGGDDPAAPVAPSAADLPAGESWSELYALGHDLLRAERLQDAAAALKGAAELNPDHAAIRYDLGYVLQLTGATGKAVEQYRRAISLRPDHPFALYNLAFLLHRSGRAEQALPLYARAVELLPNNPYVAFNYAALLQDRGELDRATALLERVVAVGGSTEIAGDARARLAELRG